MGSLDGRIDRAVARPVADASVSQAPEKVDRPVKTPEKNGGLSPTGPTLAASEAAVPKVDDADNLVADLKTDWQAINKGSRTNAESLVAGAGKAWDRIKNFDVPGLRWVARGRVDSLGGKIDRAQREIDAIEAQVMRNPGSGDVARLRAEQVGHIANIQNLGGRREKFAGMLSKHYEGKLKGPKDQVERVQGKAEAAREARDDAQGKLKEAQVSFVEANVRWKALMQVRDYSSAAEMPTIVARLAVLEEVMKEKQDIVKSESSLLQHAETQIAQWNIRHADSVRRVDRYKNIAGNGRFGTASAEITKGKKEETSANVQTEKTGGAKAQNVVSFEAEAEKRGKRLKRANNESVPARGESGENADLYETVANLIREGRLDDLPSRLEGMLDRFKNKEYINEPTGIKQLVEIWNHIAKQDTTYSKIRDDQRAKLMKLKRSGKMTLIEFGRELNETLHVPQGEVEAGIEQMAMAIDASPRKRNAIRSVS